jgi:hypothetical protein
VRERQDAYFLFFSLFVVEEFLSIKQTNFSSNRKKKKGEKNESSVFLFFVFGKVPMHIYTHSNVFVILSSFFSSPATFLYIISKKNVGGSLS